ncbi:hypothetical protein BC940DRAFT_337232, partial [Gongronella butleri]
MDPVLALFKREQGVSLKPEFYEKWRRDAGGGGQGTPQQQYEALLQHFLVSDLGAAVEPFLHDSRRPQLPETMVLQIRDVSDTSHSLLSLVKHLETNPTQLPRGSLKWVMTDGQGELLVYELDRISALKLTTPFGAK